jgi:hypothetical protein
MQPQGAEFPLDMVVTAIEVGRSARPAAAVGNCFDYSVVWVEKPAFCVHALSSGGGGL